MALYLGTDDQGTGVSTLQDFAPTQWQKMSAATRGAWLESYGPKAYDWVSGERGSDAKLSAAEAEAYRMDQGGGVKLKITPKDGEYTAGQWATIVDRQRELSAINDVRARSPWELTSVARGVAMFGAGIVDPINLATAFVPWTRTVSSLRAMQAATLAESAVTRAGARAVLGAADAGISTAVLEPANYMLSQKLGDDYNSLDSMANIAFGTAFGGGLHVSLGALGDAFRAYRGTPAPVVTPDPMRETIAPAASAVTGMDTRVKVGDVYEPARWSVVEASDLQATVDKADNQFRDRSRPAYQAEVQKRANALDPALLLGDSPVMDIGAPTLAADGRIIGGNGRTLFISRAYEIGKGDAYRAALEARLQDIGIDPDKVRAMKQPVLVRQFTREVDVKKAAMLSNEGGATDMSPLEQAKVDAERLGDAKLAVDAQGDINNAENRAAIRKWVDAQPENKRNAIMDSDGQLSPEGLRRLNAAMLFKAYGDSPTLGRLVEAVDPGSRNLAMALGRTAPVVANARAAIAAGDLHPLDIAHDLQLAVEKYNALRAQGTKVPDYLAQLDAFGDGLTPEATALLDFMGRNIGSPRRIMDAITGFVDRLNEAGNPKQSDMFGGVSAPDKGRMLQDAIDAAELRQETASDVAARLQPETREAALRAGVAQAVDGREIDVDAIVGTDPALNTHSADSMTAAADRNFSPESQPLADFEASAAVQASVDAAPKWHALEAAEEAMGDAESVLSDVVKAGDQAFKYSRGEAPGQKKAVLWQGTTARFAAEDGKPHGGFRWDMINSSNGEGAQAFGYGHYLAQQAWISQTRYRERLISNKRGSSEYSIPDGAGGVMTIDTRNNDAAWQLADGTVVHVQQKDPELAGKASAIQQVNASGYKGARETLQLLIPDARKQLERAKHGFKPAMVDGEWNILNPGGEPEYRKGSGFKSEAEAKDAADSYNAGFYRGGTLEKAQDNLSSYEGALAALDKVTRPQEVYFDEASLQGHFGSNQFYMERGGVTSGGVVTLYMKGAPLGFGNKNFASVDDALALIKSGARELAPGIKKYEPPKPDHLRTRVVAGGEEVSPSLADVISIGADDERSLSQTLGRDLKRNPPVKIKGANTEVDLHDLLSDLESLKYKSDRDALIQEVQSLIDHGVTSATIERPGSLYKAEMAAEDFQNLMLWDEPLSSQPEKVRAAFKQWGIEADALKWDTSSNGNMAAVNKRVSVLKTLDGVWVVSSGFDKLLPDYFQSRDAAVKAAEALFDKKAQSAYEDLQLMIEEGDGTQRFLDDLMEATYTAAYRRGMDPTSVGVADFGADEIASVMLHNAGVPGHAFLDGVSRGATDAPAYNLVVYSDDVARITDRYARQTGELLRATDDPAGLTEALRMSFGKDTEAIIDAGGVKIVATPDDIPGGPHPGDVKGATAPDGTVYIVASNVSEADARGMLLHEVGVHVGMEGMLGRDVFQSVLSELDDAIARGEDWAQAARDRVPADTPAGLVREEQLAYLVQHAPELPIVQRIIAAVRAWAYRTFAAARERMTLTEADFRAMAVAALHDVARGSDVRDPSFAYSRGETPDPSTTKDELKPYDDAVKRAQDYSKVLRAAADKLENDAQATAAMRSALPDITPIEIDELLGKLRRQVQGLRGVTRSVRDTMNAAEKASDMQSDAMHAADTLANNLQMAAVIEKRNAALNMAARFKATGFLNQFRSSGLDFEGFRALLVGTERKRTGGRLSVDAEQKQFRGLWLGGLIADLEKGNLMAAFRSGEFDRAIHEALFNLGRDGAGNEKLPKEAVAIAEVVNKYQSNARNTRNRFGAWIRDLQGYITRQSHDMFKIRDAGMKEYIEFTRSRIDVRKSMGDFNGSVEDFLTRVYDDFASGSHMKTPAGEDDLQAFGRGSSLARRESQSRVLYFKDGAASFEYNERFGVGKLAEQVLHGLDHAAKSAGLMKVLGTNPEATVTRLFDEYAESLRGEPARRSKFMSHRNEMANLLSTVDGSANIPGNVTAAKVAGFSRAWMSMTKLGGMMLSSITDLANYGAEMRFGQDGNMLSGVLRGIGDLTRGRAKGEKLQVLNALGVFHESTLGAVFHRFDNPDLVGGKTAWAMQQFFKLSGINWWTESLRDGYALSHSAYLAGNSKAAFDKLPASLRDMLGLYNIDANKWDLLRMAPLKHADGRMYMTPEGLRTVPRAAFENYILQLGRKVSDAAVSNLRSDLAGALRAMTIDRMHHAVIEPGARTRAFMQRGTQPGTVPGELLRFVGQFKSFPVALVQMTLGREVYGRGYDTLGQYAREAFTTSKGRGDMLQMASFIALSIGMGYATMAIKDGLRGKNPRPVDDHRTWMAAMVQGGGLGIYGDFLFGKYNRTGSSLSGSMAGPVAGTFDTLADLWTRVRMGDDVAAAAFKATLDNTPFMNLFYTRVVLDYLILYRIQEALNPGYLRRMERRVQTENGQTFYLPPSQVAR